MKGPNLPHADSSLFGLSSLNMFDTCFKTAGFLSCSLCLCCFCWIRAESLLLLLLYLYEATKKLVRKIIIISFKHDAGDPKGSPADAILAHTNQGGKRCRLIRLKLLGKGRGLLKGSKPLCEQLAYC